MKWKVLAYLGVILLMISACTKEPLILSPTERLQGEWYYHKAFFVNNNGFNRENVIADFVDCRVFIDGDFITMENLRTGQVLEGNYDLYKEDVGGYWDEDGIYQEDIERFMTAYVYDTNTNERFVYDWQINLLTRGKLHFGEYFSDGNYVFKMRKIE